MSDDTVSGWIGSTSGGGEHVVEVGDDIPAFPDLY